MAPPNTSTAPYASRGRGNGLSEARLHSSSWCPRSATTSPKTPERTLSPWMTARTSISARRAHRNLLRLQQALQLLREAESVVAVLVLEPARVPELDQHLVVPELLAGPAQIVERAILVDHVRRELEQDAAQLPRRPQWLERFEETAKHLPAKLPRRPLDPATLICRRVVAEVRRQRFELY